MLCQLLIDFLPLGKFFLFLIVITMQLMYSVVLVSSIQQSESVKSIHISTLFKILFPYRSQKSNEQSSVLYSRSLLAIYFIYSSVYMSIPTFQLIPSPDSPPGSHKFVFYICNSISVLQVSSFVPFFYIPHVSNII